MRKWLGGALLAALIGAGSEDIPPQDDPGTWDPYLVTARHQCLDGTETLACLKYQLLQRLEDFIRADHQVSEWARLVRSPEYVPDPTESRSPDVLAGYLSRKSWEFAASTDLVLEFPRHLAPGDRQPKFIDEVFSEFDTIDNKHQKPQIRNQLKKLFIPLLIILKIFKLKLLLLLPLILGVASFKKLIGLLVLVIPAVVGYLKLCRSGSEYGAHGHSSYYNRPPHRRVDPTTPRPFSHVHPDYLPDYTQETKLKNPQEWAGQSDYLPYKAYYDQTRQG